MADYTEPQQQEEEKSEVATAKARYEFLKQERQGPLDRARDCAAVTIPSLMPPEGSDENTILDTPFQSVGARGVNNLTAKLLLAMFPPGSAFFRLDVVQRLLDTLDEEGRTDFATGLAKMESQVRDRMEQKGTRTQLNEALRHLVVCGNFLIQVLNDCALKGHRLDHYVVKRDLSGTVIEMVICEPLSRKSAPPEIRALIEYEQTEQQDSKGQDRIDLFTWIRRDPSGRYWKIHQEVCGKIIPDSQSTQPLDKCSFIPLRWSVSPNEDYGRGLCEQHLGDLKSCDRLNRALIDFAAAASKVNPMVKPGGSTRRRDVARAKNLDVLEGDAREVTFLQMEKFADFRVVSETLQRVEKRLEQVFLLLSGSQRDAERVTAEEIRLLAQELEAALGGTYSVLAQELQRPLVVRVLHQMQKTRDLPALPQKSVQPQIVTGLAGLGRVTDLQRLQAAVAGVSEVFGQEAVAEYINVGEYMKRSFTALSVDQTNLLRSEEEVQKARAAKAQQDIAGKIAPQALKTVSEAQQPTQAEGATQ